MSKADAHRAAAEPLPTDLPLWELVQTYHVAAQRFREAFTSVGLTPTQYGVLEALHRSEDSAGDLSQADLARHVLIRPQSMGELVSTLLDRNLLTRDEPARRGRRAKLRLTNHGRRTLARATPVIRAVNAAQAIGLSQQQATELASLLRQVRHALGEDRSC